VLQPTDSVTNVLCALVTYGASQLKRGLERRDSLEEVKAQGIYIDTDAAQVRAPLLSLAHASM
jgi:hypothetical protein